MCANNLLTTVSYNYIKNNVCHIFVSGGMPPPSRRPDPPVTTFTLCTPNANLPFSPYASPPELITIKHAHKTPRHTALLTAPPLHVQTARARRRRPAADTVERSAAATYLCCHLAVSRRRSAHRGRCSAGWEGRGGATPAGGLRDPWAAQMRLSNALQDFEWKGSLTWSSLTWR